MKEATPVEAARRIGLGRWRHAVKLDPDKPLPGRLVRRIAASGTDAVMIGGTQRVTRAKLLGLLRHLRGAPVPVVMEVTSPACAIPGLDAYFVPVVLNAGEAEWLAGAHVRALERVGAYVPWQRVLAEGYVIGNSDCAAARRTRARAPLTPARIVAYARYAAGVLRLPVVYLEYSGAQARPGLISRVARVLAPFRGTGGHCRLFYGGGLDGAPATRRLSREVDTVVVGNALYGPRPLEVLEATLAAVREPVRPGPTHSEEMPACPNPSST